MKLHLYWFSGTGNSLLVAKAVRDSFISHNYDVEFVQIKEGMIADVSNADIVGLVFPVAGQGTYPFVWKFIENLPNGEGKDIFMVDTLGAVSGGIVGPVKGIVKSKKYNPVGALEIVMPSNFFPKKEDKKVNKIKCEMAVEKAERFVERMIKGDEKWSRVPVLPDMVSLMSKKKTIWNFFVNIYQLESDKKLCNRCGLCGKLCPVGNITYDNSGYPQFAKDCELCVRCVSFCKKAAIKTTKGKHVNYKCCEAKELLD